MDIVVLPLFVTRIDDTISHNYPSMSDKFTKLIFKKRDLPRSTGDVVGWLWTKK